ncbi:MAG: D-aminoacyl-tRNA deacylase [Acidimicrobiia bacterium]
MRVVVQRVSKAKVTVGGSTVGEIGRGLCLLVGISLGDGSADVEMMVDKVVGLRIFADGAGKMNRSILDVDGEMLIVSQFTLLGDVTRGRRPSFTGAAPPVQAAPLMDVMMKRCRDRGLSVAAGEFGAHMEVSLVNDGPVTLVLETQDGRFV